MVSILTAGDKHFFRHVKTIKNELGIRLNIWGVIRWKSPTSRLISGDASNFAEKRVYNSRWSSQFRYQKLRFYAMLKAQATSTLLLGTRCQGSISDLPEEGCLFPHV